MPPINFSGEETERDKKIVILNLENNPYIDRLYQIIQSKFDDTIMIKNINSKTNITARLNIKNSCTKSKLFYIHSYSIRVRIQEYNRRIVTVRQ